MDNMKIYLSSPVHGYQKQINHRISKVLSSAGLNTLLPQLITPKYRHKYFSQHVYEECKEMIQESDVGLLIYPYGRDSSWEVGYYKGIRKPLFAYLNNFNQDSIDRLRDWMIKGSLDEIITNNLTALKILQKDTILSRKNPIFINSEKKLPLVIFQLFKRKYAMQDNIFIGSAAVVFKKDRVLLVKEKTDSKWYLRKRGMWGYPTTTLINENPVKQSSISLFKETGLSGYNPKYICKETIPHAVGLFYKLSYSDTNNLRSGNWFTFNEVFGGGIKLRPTYINVLHKLVN
jgi:nucleoside 2-deoxyribosyltransferase